MPHHTPARGGRLRALILLLALGSIVPAAAAPAFLSLEGEWRFHTDPQDAGEQAGWQQPGFDDSAWTRAKVPGGWEEQGAPDYDGAAWYRLRVTVPAEWRGQDLRLMLGRPDDLDRAYVNGTLVGETKAGVAVPSQVWRVYPVPAAAVRFGGENVIAVRVWDGGGPGGMRGGPLGLFPRAALEARAGAPDRSGKMDLKSAFADPPAHRRILKLIHQLPEQPEAVEALLYTLAAQGFGGMATNVSFKGYLRSAENWPPLQTAVRRAREMGMAVWLYDEQGYPSGAAGGLTLEGHPEWEALGLHVVDERASGKSVDVEIPEGRLVSLAAYPAVEDAVRSAGVVRLEGRVGAGRRLRWEPPAGEWRILGFVEGRLYEGTHAAGNLFEKRPYINLLQKEPTARFLKVTHDAYAAHFPRLSEAFEATFTDEPSLLSVFMKAQGHAALPWAPDLAEEVRRRCGVDLMANLPALVADAGPETGKVRCAFWSTVSELVAGRFFGQIQEWCRAHGVASSGHLLAEESLNSHVAYYGSAYACLRRMDFPGIDCLTSDPNGVQWHIARLIGSVADQIGAPKRMSETSDHSQRYRAPGDTRPTVPISADQIRGTCNLLYVNGINTTTSYYSWNGLTTDEIHDVNTYVGRLSLPLTGGQHVCDVAVLYPVESVWAHFAPATQGATRSPECLQIERSFRSVGDQLFRAGRDFEYVDSQAVRDGRVEGDALVMAGERHRVVILPRVDTLPLDVWQKLAEFRRAGGVVVAVGTVPRNSLTQFASPEVEALTREVFGEGRGGGRGLETGPSSGPGRGLETGPNGGRGLETGPNGGRGLETGPNDGGGDGEEPMVVHANERGGAGIFLGSLAEARLAQVLERLVERDFEAPAGALLRYTHRRVEGRDFYLVINHSAEATQADVSFRAAGPAEVWDPHTGEVRPCPGETRDGRFHCRLSLRAYGSAFVAFTEARAARRFPPSAAEVARPRVVAFQEATGTAFRLETSSPPHVACAVTADGAVVRVTATVKEGERDCWCFPGARFAKAVDLSAYSGLFLRTFVPPGQGACGAEVLVFVETEGGARFLGHTGRPLGGGSGWQATPLWFSALQRYGSEGTPGPFDPSRVTAIQVGWGGYFARTGEVVAFSLGEVGVVK